MRDATIVRVLPEWDIERLEIGKELVPEPILLETKPEYCCFVGNKALSINRERTRILMCVAHGENWALFWITGDELEADFKAMVRNHCAEQVSTPM
jgi:hypothetical protein